MPLDNTHYGFATTAAAKAAWLSMLERVATLHIEAGVIIDALLPSAPATEQVFATDGASRAALLAAYAALRTGDETSVWWASEDETWHELKRPLVDDLSSQIVRGMMGYVIACQARRKAIAASISAAGSADAVLAIDLSLGWPSRALAGGEKIADDFCLSFFVGGVPDASEVLFQFVCPYPLYLEAQLAGSQWTATANATANTAIAVKRNGAALATSTYGAGTSTVTVTGMSSAVTTDIGDLISFHAPASADVTLAGITGSIVGWF
ncbi:MAG: hypothetical protein IPJ61_18315 [Tessaracoccus sp.]|uniref:hypothetical protein n=1 Tax=Tessaracoccus sp. TaxID=1971211 RepID=UPI001EC7B35E|nr:hypothetical protein [Tessaracoccus sp.]MBK7822939.1 hypothetical protein [Tessaracoccus sp.]